jgi:hypothetical protein
METSEQVQNWLNTMNNDPIVTILLENSLITKIQVETLLIEVLSDQISDNKILAKNKAKMRLSNKNISRGSYSRSLSQARKNTRKAVFTLLLLGYVGLLQTPELYPFIEVSDKMRSLIELYAEYPSSDVNQESRDVEGRISMIREEIEVALMDLTRIRRLSSAD